MAKVTEGMKVRIKARQASQEEVKNGQYCPHLGGLSGEVQRVYSNTEVAVKIEPESLPPDIQKRHRQQEDTMRNRWLESLSDEARNRLTPEEKAFHLNYVVLVAAADLEPFKGTKGGGETRGQGDKETGRQGDKETSKASKTTTTKPVATKQAQSTRATQPSAIKQLQSARATKPSATPATMARSSPQEVKTTRLSKQSTLFDEPPPKRRTMKELEKAEEQYLKTKKKGRSS